jgi:hypothetical protein
VAVEIGSDGVDTSHPDAVVSIGVSDHVDSVGPVTPEVVYRQVCWSVHVFADESWAAGVGAGTTSVELERGIGVTRGLADAVFA